MSAIHRAILWERRIEFADLFPVMRNADLATRFGVPQNTVRAFSYEIGLYKDPAHLTRVKSVALDLDEFAALFPTTSTADLMRHFGIAQMTVHKYARKLGLYKSHEYKSALMAGQRNHSWKGGRAPRSRYSVRYLAWRMKVIGRDEFTCRRCGFYNRETRYLVAHHLRGWAEYPPGRYDPANGVCLCEDCHRVVHGHRPRYLGPTHRPCACGCGTLIRAFDAHRRPVRYVHGHYKRQEPQSPDSIAKMLETKRNWSPEHRAEVGARISATKKALGQGPSRATIDAAIAANTGRKASPETRARMSDAHRRRRERERSRPA